MTGAPDGLPPGKRFAFTILDDTDDATIDNVGPLYDLLSALGMRTTKTVWPVEAPEGSNLFFAGQTLEDHDYLEWIRSLHDRGFEIAFHCATRESSERSRTERALRVMEQALGIRPRVHCNHGQNRENLYWGVDRYRSRLLHFMASAAVRRRQGHYTYSGHEEGSPFFWGDIARETFSYVRSFTYPVLDISRYAPLGPYRDPTTPYVRSWFCTADAPDVRAFRRLITRDAVDRLASSGGVAIVSTHLGKGFCTNGRVDPEIEDALRYIASLPGWFEPTGQILDALSLRQPPTIRWLERRLMEFAHLYFARRKAGRRK